jgi:hypothetical protein
VKLLVQQADLASASSSLIVTDGFHNFLKILSIAITIEEMHTEFLSIVFSKVTTRRGGS